MTRPIPTTDEQMDDLVAPDDCPVRALGRSGSRYFFAAPNGEFIEMGVRDFSTNGLLSLFDGDSAWLIREHPVKTKKGKEADWFDTGRAAADLMQRCVVMGIFDPATPVRGPGVWKDREGVLIVHAGDALWYGGGWGRAGQQIDGALYMARSRVQRPSLEARQKQAGPEAGSYLRETIARWNFDDPAGPDILTGWIGAACLGAATDWHAHILVSGQRGAGKSELMKLSGLALGGGAHGMLNNVTEAGLRQMMTDEARAVLIDEAEKPTAGGPGPIDNAITLLRQASGGDGANAVRGSVGGRVQRFNVTASAYLSAIVPPRLKPQDASRITRLFLKPLAVSDAAKGELTKRMDRIAQASPRLRARVLNQWARWRDTFAVYRAAVMEKGGDSRVADQLATLLAGRDLLLYDEPPHPDSVSAIVEACANFLIVSDPDDPEETEGARCWQHLLSFQAEMWRGGDRINLGAAIENALADYSHVTDPVSRASLQQDAAKFAKGLETYGLKLDREGGRENGRMSLLVATGSHQALRRIFQNTVWDDDGWTEALRYLPGAERAPRTVRFAGVTAKATRVPAAFLPFPEKPQKIDKDTRGGGDA